MTGRKTAVLAALIGGMTAPALAEDWQNPAERYLLAHKAYAEAKCPIAEDGLRHFVYLARDRDRLPNHSLLALSRFEGAQIMYSWRDLEPEPGRYEFGAIEADAALLGQHGKRLFVQLQDASFSPGYEPVPDYLLTPEYDGGVTAQLADDGDIEGWVAKRWNPEVEARFAALLAAMGEALDGRIAGVNLQETAIGVTPASDPSFAEADYVPAIQRRMQALKAAFPHSMTLQYANFMPGEWLPHDDKGYLRAVYAYGNDIGVGLGAPDLMPRRKGQLNHALALMHEGRFDVPLAIAVQDGNYTGSTGDEAPGGSDTNPVPMLEAFAADFLKAGVMFWSDQEPYFSAFVLPCLAPKP